MAKQPIRASTPVVPSPDLVGSEDQAEGATVQYRVEGLVITPRRTPRGHEPPHMSDGFVLVVIALSSEYFQVLACWRDGEAMKKARLQGGPLFTGHHLPLGVRDLFEDG